MKNATNHGLHSRNTPTWAISQFERVGGWRLEVGDWRLEVGSWKLEAGSSMQGGAASDP
jgi:hypothetical protein